MSEKQNKSEAAIAETAPGTENTTAVSVKKSLKKKIIKIACWAAIVLFVIIVIALWQIDRIAATATRTVGSMLTGTKVDVESISISPLAGAVKVNGFTVGNPEGFHNPAAIKVGKFHVDVAVTTVLSNKIVVEQLELSDVAIDLEYTFSRGSNLDVILKNVEKSTGADKKQAEAEAEKESDSDAEADSAAEKQVVIRKLILKNAKVTVSSGTLKTTMMIPLLPIEMENVGEGSDLAGTIREVLLRVITEIGKVVNFDALSKGIVSGAESAAGAVSNALEESVKFFKKLPSLNKK